jgi:5-methyltetrahydropteroyltriglutamate--homocysteine methyltransferase
VGDLQFLRAHTESAVKMTVPGPFTMSQQAHNDDYDREEELAVDYAAAVNEAILELFAAGADIVQSDAMSTARTRYARRSSPALRTRSDAAR